MKTHSAEGARIVGKFGRLREAVPIIRHHHERWDGQGYPDGLAADEIPLEAAIVGLADAWDAMTTDRPYHPRCSPRRRCRGPRWARDAVRARSSSTRSSWPRPCVPTTLGLDGPAAARRAG